MKPQGLLAQPPDRVLEIFAFGRGKIRCCHVHSPTPSVFGASPAGDAPNTTSGQRSETGRRMARPVTAIGVRRDFGSVFVTETDRVYGSCGGTRRSRV